MAKQILIVLAVLGLTNCGSKPAAETVARDTVTSTTAIGQPAPLASAPSPRAVSPRAVEVPAPPAMVGVPKDTAAEPTPAATTPLHTGAASIAYSYKLAFELPARRIDAAQNADRAACEVLGLARCQVLNSSRIGGITDAASASLELRIVPAVVRTFTAQREASTANFGGSLLRNSTTGEDITRQLIDADAALKAKRTLRDRLQDLLAHHRGNLADLLDVEKSLSETQQELDTATAELAELRQRISFSELEIGYRSERPLGSTTARPLADAIANAGQTISGSLAVMLTLTLALAPWLIPLGLLVFLYRWWQARRRLRALARAAQPPLPL